MTASGNALAAAYDAAGRHEEAINALAVAAREGDAEAMTDLSKRLLVGDRAPCMPAQAVLLLGDAARAGSSARDFIRSRAVFNTPAENVA